MYDKFENKIANAKADKNHFLQVRFLCERKML